MDANDHLRSLGQRRKNPLRDEGQEEEAKPASVISQGARSRTYLSPPPSPDDLLRSFRRSRSFGAGGWERIA